MIITRTPYRISFFGGGTDYPIWFEKHGGCVLGATINKYCWLAVRPRSPFGPRFKVSYSQVEECDSIDDIKHPAVRECLRFMGIEGCEIYHTSDLPARSGIGSSSAFVVGLLNALKAMTNRRVGATRLAEKAVYIEQKLLRENVGCQDQYLTTLGGINQLDFYAEGMVSHTRVVPCGLTSTSLNRHLLLYYTGVQRTSSDITGTYVGDLQEHHAAMKRIYCMPGIARDFLYQWNEHNARQFGHMLGEGWLLKRLLGDKITTPHIDGIYDKAMSAGALGGKLLGGGGGGFLLLFVPLEKQPEVREAMGGLVEVPFRFDFEGSQVVYHE